MSTIIEGEKGRLRAALFLCADHDREVKVLYSA
jgi:hypothetical protein